jgi:hypothetical protein
VDIGVLEKDYSSKFQFEIPKKKETIRVFTDSKKFN